VQVKYFNLFPYPAMPVSGNDFIGTFNFFHKLFCRFASSESRPSSTFPLLSWHVFEPDTPSAIGFVSGTGIGFRLFWNSIHDFGAIGRQWQSRLHLYRIFHPRRHRGRRTDADPSGSGLGLDTAT
jgi:hypothetical protein